MKRTKLILVALALMLAASGCNLIQIDEARDAATVVATVNSYEITKADFNQLYNYYKYYYNITEEMEKSTDKEMRANIRSFKESLLDALVLDGVQIVKAQQNGCYAFSAEEQAEIDAYVQETLDSYRELLKSDIEAEQPGITEDALAAEVENRLPAFLAEYDSSEEKIRENKENSVAHQKLVDQVTADVQKPTEDEVRADYDQRTSDQQAAYADGSANYEQLAAYGQPVYYVPEGVRMAKHILIKLTDEQVAEIRTLRQNGDNDAAVAKRDEYLPGIEQAAQQAYERAAAGEDFDALIDELGEDPGMETNEYYALMNPSSVYAEEFTAGLFGLAKPGDISMPTASDFGYHIILYYGDLPSGPVDYATVSEDIYEEIYTNSKDEYFNLLVQEWEKEMTIKKYPARVR